MVKIKKRNYIISLILVFILGAGSCLAFMNFSGSGTTGGSGISDSRTFARLTEMKTFLKDNFYQDITDSAIETGLFRGLFASVEDPYTVYYTEEEFNAASEATRGENSGIGVVMNSNDDDQIQVIEVVEDAPAESVGIKAGDIIVAVDGKEFSGEQVSEAATAARGEAGTKVVITVYREGKTSDYEVTRANFINPSVSTEELDDNLGYIRVSTFNENTAEDFETALNEFENKGVKGLVIDLRNNLGGIVQQGVDIADLLLDEADIAYVQNNKGEKEFLSTKNGKTDLPYVLLVNENSASTSEILAVGIKENKGGPLVGVTTFGKGVIQKLQRFDEGDGARITIAQYFSPSGNPINNVGVKPDYEIKADSDDKEDVQLNKAISLLNE